MDRTSRTLIAAATLAARGVLAPSALADERTCAGAIGAEALDNVRSRYRARVRIRRDGRLALRAVVGRQRGVSARVLSHVVSLNRGGR